VATNKKFSGNTRSWPVTASSGDPVVRGQVPAVALTDTDTDTGFASVDMAGVYLLTVKGIDTSGNSAVADGDQLYFTPGDTPKINKKNTGVPFGTAYGTVGAGSTATIQVEVGK